jgi:hypothetical protein
MIVKNISPYPKTFKGLGNKQLMPGEECDFSSFSQKERDNCEDLQEGFRKGELICIGIGHQDTKNLDGKMRMARARAAQVGALQPLIEVQRGQRISPNRVSKLDEVRNPTSRDENREEPPISSPFSGVKPLSRPVRPTPKIFDKPTGVIERNSSGITTIRPLQTPQVEVLPTLRPEPVKEKSPPIITPDRVREIWAQRCISFRTNGQKCRRWAARGSTYCTAHMPEEERKRRKQDIKAAFFDKDGS